jgi:hypothetical protein
MTTNDFRNPARMKYEEILQMLEFSQEWIDLGIITPEILEDLRSIHEEELEEMGRKPEEYNWELAEIDSEHFRWRAFTRFLKEKKHVPSEMVTALYKLGEKDPDQMMGRSMMRYVLDEKNCPMELLELALQAEEKFLVKAANQAIERRKKLVSSSD